MLNVLSNEGTPSAMVITEENAQGDPVQTQDKALCNIS